jgi:flagellar hook-associated protein 2
MTAVSFTGLASGLDTASLVTSLVNAERAPANAIAAHQSDLNTQKSIIGSLSSALSSLATSVRALSLPSDSQPRTATSSDGHVTVAASSGAIATVHDVRVKQLARGAINSSIAFDTADAGVAGTGSVTITTGSTSQQIDYGASDSLADIATKINNAGLGASASVLFDGSKYRLMVASTDTGTAAAARFTETGNALGLSDDANIKVGAQDAIATIDGVDVTRGKNVIDDAVAGLTFTLVSPHAKDPAAEASSTVTVALDKTALTSKLQAVVSAYNAVNGALHVQLDYTGTQKGTNTLFGDSTLRGLQGALGGVMSSGYGPGATTGDMSQAATLGAIGLTRDKTGNLSLDTTKLATALSANPNAVGDLFVKDGFATAMTNLTDTYTRAGNGMFASKSQSLTARFNLLQTQADQINTRADALKTQLENQFSALETAMSQLKSQSSFLTSILG